MLISLAIMTKSLKFKELVSFKQKEFTFVLTLCCKDQIKQCMFSHFAKSIACAVLSAFQTLNSIAGVEQRTDGIGFNGIQHMDILFCLHKSMSCNY